ncbi:MAG: hypothetical protein UX16_C0006G0003 [Parcubacteria group bacterium GW2011_GWB1_45_7]|uniref:HTH deoR-type domain-containing protein n=2 Tax=Candidatus Colwelliibacteriota TaxID=1817904 RepID=A0A1G1ZCH7_9BACT|nr:MAG: hypothetical protein UX16_C0006G0003 [Parcubacteria group bacterium GW2011_GWB1_45_7]OGY60805.1 MAG: hypothetical protein A3I33_02525 [Candidatus Colwellbacteria bacterium RIFCSPLOWO2_02_FULL_45_11]OGY62079.1 MAG: hypothetical protein A3G58_01890 [Candidatus Colwellbacteria bacterium RIFCSPLOWO2_12_FULL_46_17]
MFEETPTSSLAHKISFAVFRVVRLVRNKKLRDELESAAVDLVRDLNVEKIGVLDRLVALAEAVGEMNETNSGVLRRELSNLYGMVSLEGAKSAAEVEAVYLGDIFDSRMEGRVDAEAVPARQRLNAGAEERQTAITGFIRQFPGDCRMKDLSTRFAHVSERTLRNDIQALIKSGLVERLGGKGGPSSYFVLVHKSEGSGGSLPDRILLPESTRF